jgi:hypothetical protein
MWSASSKILHPATNITAGSCLAKLRGLPTREEQLQSKEDVQNLFLQGSESRAPVQRATGPLNRAERTILKWMRQIGQHKNPISALSL